MYQELAVMQGELGSVVLGFILEINFYFDTDSSIRGSDHLSCCLDLVA